MSITEAEFLREFGPAVEYGEAVLFVGSGLSSGAGLDGWADLLDPLLEQIGVTAHPTGSPNAQSDAGSRLYVPDLPLAAEYFVRRAPGGHDRLHEAIRAHITRDVSPTESQRLLMQLPVPEVWTTNYDRLLEQAAVDDPKVVVSETELRDVVEPGRKRIIKMHGGVTADGSDWQVRPIITRTDFERYDQEHPLYADRLRATFLTRPMLFVGFGFQDPNVEVLLRLARTIDASPQQHFAIMRRPAGELEVRQHELRAEDLSNSGVQIVEVSNHSEVTGILRRLVRRTKAPRLFVTGSDPNEDEANFNAMAQRVGDMLSRPMRDHRNLKIVSLAGPAALQTSFGVATVLRPEGNYQAERFEFHFRHKSGDRGGAPPHDERVGSLIFSPLRLQDLRTSLIDGSRAMLVIGGGARTMEEVRLAQQKAVPVLPFAHAGGTALEIWEEMSGAPEDGSIAHEYPETFARLADQELTVALAACEQLILRALGV